MDRFWKSVLWHIADCLMLIFCFNFFTGEISNLSISISCILLGFLLNVLPGLLLVLFKKTRLAGKALLLTGLLLMLVGGAICSTQKLH